jgi:hypothetical protein
VKTVLEGQGLTAEDQLFVLMQAGHWLWRAGGVQSVDEEVTAPAVVCLIFQALSEWHFGEIAPCHATMAEAISLAKELTRRPSWPTLPCVSDRRSSIDLARR